MQNQPQDKLGLRQYYNLYLSIDITMKMKNEKIY